MTDELRATNEAIERISAQAAEREAGVQRYVARQYVGRPVTPEQVEQERGFATVAGVRLSDLRAILSRLAELEEALLNIDCAAAVSHNGTEAATITFILTETKRILDPSRAALDGEG